jgi:hypothetical protein
MWNAMRVPKFQFHLGVRSSSPRPSQRTHGSAVPWSFLYAERSLLLILCRVVADLRDRARTQRRGNRSAAGWAPDEVLGLARGGIADTRPRYAAGKPLRPVLR